MPTCTQIIASFELQTGDVTELSTSEELSVLNRVYQKICAKRPWEFLKTAATGSVLTDSVGSYIAVPGDFAFFAINASNTNINYGIENEASPRVIFVGSGNSWTPYQIINYSDRRSYRNQSGYAYLDMVNNKIYFTTPPVSGTYEFDYIKVPATLVAGDTPVLPSRFHDLIVYGMTLENDVLQLSKNATAYSLKNQIFYDEFMNDMVYYNAQLQLN